MQRRHYMEMGVGLFVLFSVLALGILAFKISGLTNFFPTKNYTITATFDDIGALKVRAPVKISGVQIGEVSHISLDRGTFRARVKMHILNKFNAIPDDSSAGIFTAGLLGDNFIAITPMYNQTYLKEGSQIQITRSAMVLEKLIGQFIYKMNSDSGKQGDNHATS